MQPASMDLHQLWHLRCIGLIGLLTADLKGPVAVMDEVTLMLRLKRHARTTTMQVHLKRLSHHL